MEEKSRFSIKIIPFPCEILPLKATGDLHRGVGTRGATAEDLGQFYQHFTALGLGDPAGSNRGS